MSQEMDRCGITCIHAEVVALAKSQALDEHTVTALAEIFKALGDPTRIRILHALKAREMCVCDLAVVLGHTQSAVSHQLRLLRTMGLVKNRKEGKVVYYSLDDEHVEMLFQQGLEHVRHR